MTGDTEGWVGVLAGLIAVYTGGAGGSGHRKAGGITCPHCTRSHTSQELQYVQERCGEFSHRALEVGMPGQDARPWRNVSSGGGTSAKSRGLKVLRSSGLRRISPSVCCLSPVTAATGLLGVPAAVI
uniref:Uncharacterized protein n=1 Tax=Knipowitschia caucasica TaxID=637954 RepID=A0AAV2J768_KNICA